MSTQVRVPVEATTTEFVQYGDNIGPLAGLFIFICFVIMIVVSVWVFQVLYNSVIPEVYGQKQLTFTQALLLLVVVRMLIG